MLVLSRKNDESVVVGGTNGIARIVKVTVLEISGGHVKLGFEANGGFDVHREEVWERIRAGGRRGPPTAGPNWTRLGKADGMETVLSGMGKGRSPKSVRDRV
jgi:carbon storage regulator CsrA